MKYSLLLVIITVIFAYPGCSESFYKPLGNEVIVAEVAEEAYAIEIVQVTPEGENAYNMIRINGKDLHLIDEPFVSFFELDPGATIPHVYMMHTPLRKEGCEGKFFIVDLNDFKNPFFSKTFGNCYLPRVFRQGDEIVMMFPTWRENEFVQYRYSRGQLTKKKVRHGKDEFRKVIETMREDEYAVAIIQTSYHHFLIEVNGVIIKYINAYNLSFFKGEINPLVPGVYFVQESGQESCQDYLIIDLRKRDHPIVTDLFDTCAKFPDHITVDGDDLMIQFTFNFPPSLNVKYSNGHIQKTFN
ncbi:MAG: hypothetical protein HQL76_02940 [Magnetococcales bacterium]|nr:hypothetical protein [Magnetococcales bacterium]